MFVIDSLGGGGAEHSTVLLAQALKDLGVDVSLAVLGDSPGLFGEALSEHGVPLLCVNARGPLAVIRLRRELRRSRTDIVHTALFAADQIGRLAGLLSGTRVVSSWVSVPRLRRFRLPSDPPAWKVLLVNLYDAALCHLTVDKFHAVSDGVARLYSSSYRISASRVVVVERGRPLALASINRSDRRQAVRTELGLTDSDLVIVTAGRHDSVKDHVSLVRAVADLACLDKRVHLVIAGREGDSTELLLREIESTPGADRFVHLLGHRSDIPEILSAADVMALPSVFEGTAGVALEAMALGTPIVSTNLEGMAGILEHETNALIVPVRNPKSMAAAIRRLLDDQELAERLAAAGRADFLERFTLERSAERMIELYRSVLAEH